MKIFRLFNYTHFLGMSFLFLAATSYAVADKNIYISQEELREVIRNADEKYDYLDSEFSNLYEVISRICDLEDNDNSIISDLKNHIEDGSCIGLHHAVLQALEYAERTLERNISRLNDEDAESILNDLASVINQVAHEKLVLNPKNLSALVEEAPMDDAITRCGGNICSSDGCPVERCKGVKVREQLDALNNARFKRNVQIDGKLKVYGKSVFKNDVTFEDDVKFKDEVKFKDDVKFEDDVLIKGDLTVDGTVTFNGPIQGLTIIDVVVENLSATDIVVENLSAVDAFVDNLSVNDLVINNCMDNLCVNNLSVVDAVVTGTLSVTNEIIQNLSATDGFIDSLSVNDLAVANCIEDLCVNNLSVGDLVIASCVDAICVGDLSVTDLVVSGTASINDAVIGTLSATDAVIDNLSVTDLTVLSCMESLCVDTLSVTDIVFLSCLDSLCVESLSAVDAVISGTLSVNDAVIDNLSATDGFIDNLSVTDLVVIDCIDDLCVTNLSATDIFAGSLSLCDLIVGCDIFMNNTNGPAIGNIMKAGNRFIHNAGTDNTFVGVNSGNFAMTGAENVGIGRNALFSNTTGFNNTAVGAFSMNTNTIGANNSAYGSYALVNNTQGNENVGLGNYAMVTNTTGLGNTAVGFQAGYSLSVGNNNVFVGNNAGLNVATGFTNVMIGYNTGLSLTTGNDNIYISNPGVANETGAIRIGTPSTHTTAFIQGIFGTAVAGTGIPVFIDANGQLGTVVSSERFKHDIEDMNDTSEDIYKLRPVTFIYNGDESETVQYGLIAEETDKVFPALVVYDEEGKPFTVRYHLLPQLLLNEVQKLNATVQEQAITINELKKDNINLNKLMNKVLARLSLHN